MILLIGFALLAGAGTALSPCVLPVLPALLSAGGIGGHRRPLGIVLGLSITFTVTIVGLANVVDGVGLGSDPLRDVAIVVLLAFGVALIVPGLSDRLEAPLSRLARFGPRSTGDGFLSGLLVGGALGFVYTPCASPILAAVISVSAASGRTVVLAIAYAGGWLWTTLVTLAAIGLYVEWLMVVGATSEKRVVATGVAGLAVAGFSLAIGRIDEAQADSDITLATPFTSR